MGCDELHTREHLLGYPIRQLLLGYSPGKVYGHIVLQIFHRFLCLQLFTLLNVGVDKMLGLLNIHTAWDGGEFPNHCDQTDE